MTSFTFSQRGKDRFISCGGREINLDSEDVWPTKSINLDDTDVTDFGPCKQTKFLLPDSDAFQLKNANCECTLSATMTVRAVVSNDGAWYVTQTATMRITGVSIFKGVFAYINEGTTPHQNKRPRDCKLELDRNGLKHFEPGIHVHGFGWNVKVGFTEQLNASNFHSYLEDKVERENVVCYVITSFTLDEIKDEIGITQKNMLSIVANLAHHREFFHAYVLRKNGHKDVGMSVPLSGALTEKKMAQVRNWYRVLQANLDACVRDGKQNEEDVAANNHRRQKIQEIMAYLS